MRISSVAGACALGLVVLLSGNAAAQETGVAEIHSWVKVGRKTCMLDHYHDGNGNGKTRALAQKAAISSWSEFTAWEYGAPWGRYSLAAGKTMNCSQSSPGMWNCHTQARPCRSH